MSLYLSSRTLMAPTLPLWLENTCQKLADNAPSLTTLELSRTRIDDVFARVVARALEENHTVTAMILSCHSLVDDGAFAIGSVVAVSKTMKKFQLRDLRNSREIVTFFQLLLQNTSLEEISLRHAQICPKSAYYVANFLRSHSRLQEVRLVDCQLLGNSLEIICDGLQGNKTLQRLYMVNTEIQESQAVHISSMLAGGAPCLCELYLCENNLGDEGVAILTSGLLLNQSVRHLDLRSNGITAEGCLSLQGLIRSSEYLSSLNLANNQVNRIGVTALTRGLACQSCVLQKLDLSSNDIDPLGARVLAGMLSRCTPSNGIRLQELNLAFNSVGDQGAIELARALVRNKTLLCLNLRRNDITDVGALSVAHALPSMEGLKHLLINKNHFTQKGSFALLEGLRCNVSLEYLHVEDKQSGSISKEIFYWNQLNKAGRRVFRRSDVTVALWPLLYSRVASDPDIIFYFLKEKPELVSPCGTI